MESSFKDFYDKELRAKLKNDLSLKNINEVPKLTKIVINAGVKSANDSKLLNYVYDGVSTIAGQKPVKTKAKKSIAGFKIREGLQIGCMVTLRGKKMYSFFEKLVRAVIPAIRDFRGLPAKFDNNGNYNLGFKDWSVFPEVIYDKFPAPHGLNISFHIKNGNAKEGSYAFFKGFGMPFIEAKK